MLRPEINTPIDAHQMTFEPQGPVDAVQLNFNKSPSSLLTLWQAFVSQRHTCKPGQPLPDVELNRARVGINPKHLRVFNKICRYQNTTHIPLLYPFTLVYPCILRVLSHKSVPLSIFRSLNTRNQLASYQPLKINDIFDVHTRLSDYRVIEKGMEIDVASSIYKGRNLMWENISTYYYRGMYGQSDDAVVTPRLDPIQDGQMLHQFRINAKNGFRFARLTGDTNGIHYSSFYARMLGFKGAFAQPLRVVSECLQHIPDLNAELPAQLTLFYKGPVYYNHLLSMTYAGKKNAFRFDLHSENNDRPCICGHYLSNV